jgi:hypothetical protein
MGSGYLEYLKASLADDRKGNADLVAYFLLRAQQLLKTSGTAGLVGTKTVAEGDTHDVGMAYLIQHATVYRCTSPATWSGDAKVVCVTWHWLKGTWEGAIHIDDHRVSAISSQLTASLSKKPSGLIQSVRPYQGSYVHGMGFMLTEVDRTAIVGGDPGSAEVIFPCLSAEDFNSSPDQRPSRFVIYFGDRNQEEAQKFRGAWLHIDQNVKDERKALGNGPLSKFWWRFKRPTKPLYDQIWPKDRVLVCPVVTKHLSFAWVNTRVILLNRMYAFIGSSDQHFAVLQSSLYGFWAWHWSGRMKKDLQFAPTDCFDNFPFPGEEVQHLSKIGVQFHEIRRQIMSLNNQGLTATYNRFHDPTQESADVERLRVLQMDMDHAVSGAYGWSGVDLNHGFYETKEGVRFTVSEPAKRFILEQLLTLNHKRYDEEVRAGLHEKKASRKSSSSRDNMETAAAQGELL